MRGFRIFDAAKLVKARGARTQQEICDAAGNAFSTQQLSNWERGLNKPKDETIPILLTALGVDWEDISTPPQVTITVRTSRAAA